MKIRQALSCDAGKLHALEEELFSAADFPLSHRSFYYHIHHNLLYVAETEAGAIAGYALALIQRRDAKLYSLGVASVHRGSGLSGLLMRQILQQLAILGFKRTLLEVRCDNTPAIALYRKFGFSITKKLDAFYRDGCDAYLMEKEHA
ncbi:N-acetyltransferase [Sulfurimonas sp. HSL3-7]|uniref:N-acetyltransferase n=1 Tax=Sulfonitrofixus jiaomeiensis TaxID=3131938 RepID=UPI0031F76EB0